MANRILVGEKLPPVTLGYLEDGTIRTASVEQFFGRGRLLILGVPGAFTPVCTQQHVPDFVKNADLLKTSGYRELFCIASNDPFTIDAWAETLDPQRKIRFLADGNLDFATALGLVQLQRDLFLGRRSERFLLVVENLVIQALRVESSILTVACTFARDALELQS